MKYDPKIHHRHTIRLAGYDYRREGRYFVTLVTQERVVWFGEIRDGQMQLNVFGAIARQEWWGIRVSFGLENDDFVVMPNHIHGIIAISERSTSALPLGTIVGQFKSRTTRRIQALRHKQAIQPEIKPVWQRNYYEHIIRDDPELERIRAYIRSNPESWAKDPEFSP